jgi:hypothetical protein
MLYFRGMDMLDVLTVYAYRLVVIGIGIITQREFQRLVLPEDILLYQLIQVVERSMKTVKAHHVPT